MINKETTSFFYRELEVIADTVQVVQVKELYQKTLPMLFCRQNQLNYMKLGMMPPGQTLTEAQVEILDTHEKSTTMDHDYRALLKEAVAQLRVVDSEMHASFLKIIKVNATNS